MSDNSTFNRPVGICDVSGVPTWFVKGRGASAWLSERVRCIPKQIHETLPVDETDGTQLIRTGVDEFLIEFSAGTGTSLYRQLCSQTNRLGNFYACERHDAIFFLTSNAADTVLAQTCGINWELVEVDVLVMTSVAGVSCAIRPTSIGGRFGYLLRVDPTYAVYLWEQLLTICEELGGGEIGLADVPVEQG